MPRRSSPSPRDGTELGHLIPRHPAGFFEGLVPITERCPIRYHAQERRRRVGRLRSLQLRAGARADGRLLHRRRHAPAAVRQARRARDGVRGRRTARILRSGRPTRGASASSARSTTGTAGAIRCGSGSIPASGKCSSRRSGRARSTSSRSSGRTASCCRSRPIPSRGSRSCGRRPPRSSPIRRRSPGPTQKYIEERAQEGLAADADVDLRGASRLVAASAPTAAS